MTEEFKAFRILLVPLGLLIAFLVFPRLCFRKPEPAAEQQTTSSAAPAAAQPAGGLRIDGAPLAPPEAKGSTFPDGLDAARVQYLVEVSPEFSEPKTAKVLKISPLNEEVASVLKRKGYIDIDPKTGAVTMTREGLLNLDLREEADGWTFPIAKRAFDKVTYVSRVEDDKYDVTFTWHYNPTAVGTELKVDGNKTHQATAQFVGGPGGWALSTWTVGLSDLK